MRLLAKSRVAVLLFWTAAFLALPLFADDDPEQIRQMLLAAIRANKAALSERIRIVLVRTVNIENGVEMPDGVTEKITVDGNRYAVEYYLSKDDYERGRDCGFTACDGEMVLVCRSEAYPYGRSGPRASLMPWTEHISHTFTRDFYLRAIGWQDAISPEELLSSPNVVIDPVPKEINGVKTFEVSLRTKLGEGENETKDYYTFKYWFAPDFSCNPVKSQMLKDGKVGVGFEYGNFSQLSNGIWFPGEVTSGLFMANGTIEAGSRYLLEKVSVDFTVDEGLFDTSLDRVPAGYMIHDRTTGLDYVQGQGPVSDETVSRLVAEVSREFLGDLEKVDVSEAGHDATRPDASVEVQAEDDADTAAAAGQERELPADGGLSGVLLAVMALVALAAAVAVAARHWRRRRVEAIKDSPSRRGHR